MKVKVLKPFRDKYTKEIYKKGSIIEVTEERAAEITAALGDGYIKKVQEKEPAKSAKGKEPAKGGKGKSGK